jgi:uncharacterized protein
VSPDRRADPVDPGERLGRDRLGDDVVVEPTDGGALSGPDHALGLVDLLETDHRRAPRRSRPPTG